MNHPEILKKLSEYATKVLTAGPEELLALSDVIQEAKVQQQAVAEKGKSVYEPAFSKLTKEIKALQKREDKENAKAFTLSLHTLLQQTQEARTAWDFDRMDLLMKEMSEILADAKKTEKEPAESSTPSSYKPKPLKEKLKVFQGANAKALKQAKAQREKREAFQLELGMKIEELGEDLSPELRDILVEHRRCAPNEVKVFGDHRWLDDVLDFVPDLVERKKLLLDINDAMQTAIARQKRFFRALEKYKREHPEELKSSDGKEAIKNAQELGARLLNHIPSTWLTESPRLASRINTLCKDPEEQESIKENAKEISPETREAEREVFRKVIEHGSLKKMDRTAFFFDLPLRSIPPEMNQTLMNANEKIIERAYQIRDAGGTVEEVEESMKHIPPEFWPPAFIENLQAWRVAERELAEERTKALFEEDKLNLGDIGDCFNFALDTVGTLASINDMAGTALELNSAADTSSVEAGIPCAWRDAPNVVEAITGFSEVIRSGFGYGTAVKDALVSEDYSDIDAEKLNDIMDGILEQVKTFSGTLMNLTWGAQAVYKEFNKVNELPTEGFLAGEFIPVLAAVVAGIDLKQALTVLGKAIKMRAKTGQMLDEAKLEYISSKRRDGGAFVRAVRNERNARNRQITEKSVDVTAKSLTFAGEVTLSSTGATGFGAAAGLALKVTAQGVEYGGKVAFTVHDWSLAKTAKELIEQAQAGNPIARLEIMEKSGLYAKMYICHLAITNDPLATRFVAERGIRDEDLKKPAMAMKIVRELLDHADQKDETQVADNLGKAIAQGVMGEGTVLVAEKLGIAVKGLSETAVRKMRKKGYTYDAERWASEKWKPPYANAISPDNWSKNKEAAQKIGYYPQNTGIKVALEKALKAQMQAEKTLRAFEKTGEKREEILPAVTKSQKILLEARNTVMQVFPISIDGGPHDPMIACLNDLRNLLASESNNFDNWLLRLKIKDKDWTASKAASLEPGDWKANWEDAKNKCGLEEKDEGLSEALTKAEKYAEAAAEEGMSLLALRQARVGLRDAFVEAANALKKLYAISSPFAGLRTYLDEMMAVLIRASQENDEALNGKEWKNNPVKNPTFSADLWGQALEAAVDEGFIPDVKDQGVGKSLQAYEKQVDELKNADDPQKKLKLRVGVMKELSRSVKALDKVIQTHKDTHSELLYYFSWMRNQAFEKAAALGEEQEKIDFDLDKAFTHTAWKTSYDNAVKAGAVPPQNRPSQTLYRRLESYFGKYDKRIEEAKEAAEKLNYEWADQNAEHAEKDLTDALKALTKISNAPGYRRNIKMEAYLSELQDKVMKEIANDPFRGIMFAEARAKFGTPAFQWKNKGIGGWQEVKKNADIAGLIKKANNKTGFGDSIDTVLKAEKKMPADPQKAKKGSEKQQETFEEALAVMDKLAEQLGSNTSHPGFKGYFENARKAVEEKRNTYFPES